MVVLKWTVLDFRFDFVFKEMYRSGRRLSAGKRRLGKGKHEIDGDKVSHTERKN